MITDVGPKQMSQKHMNKRQRDGVERLATLITGGGFVSMIAGFVAWLLVRDQIADEKIVVAGAAEHFAGRRVTGPLTAYEEANVIKRLALKATGGKTYGELDEGDPAAETAMDASLLRASLFTSILAFGVAAAQVALGGALIAIGVALSRLSRQGCVRRG